MKKLYSLLLLAVASTAFLTSCDKEPGDDKKAGGDVSASITGTWIADYQEHPTADGRIERRELKDRTLTFTAEGTFTTTQSGAVVSYGTYRLDGDQLHITSFVDGVIEEGTADGGYDPKPGGDDDAFLPGTGGTRAAETRIQVVTVVLLTDDRFAFTGTEDDGYVYTIYFHRQVGGDDVNYPVLGDINTEMLAGSWMLNRIEWTEADGTSGTETFRPDEEEWIFATDGHFTIGDTEGPYEFGTYTLTGGGWLTMAFDDGVVERMRILTLTKEALEFQIEEDGDVEIFCFTRK